MMKPFRQRNPTMLAIAGIALLAVLVGGAVLLPQALSYAYTVAYSAEFANAAGLRPGDEVYIAGVPSGEVTDVALEGTHVRVEFRLTDARELGEATTASVKLLTILGKRYLAVTPKGPGTIAPGGTISRQHTSVPFDLDDLGRRTAQTAGQLNIDRLRTMIDTLRQATPESGLTGKALRGITATSTMLTKYSDQLRQVLRGAKKLTSILVRQKDTLVTLLGNAELVASALAEHRQVIRALVTEVSSLSSQLTAFLNTNSEILGPLVSRLNKVLKALNANEKSLSKTLELLAPTSRYLANATGNGPWADINSVSAIVPDNVLCAAGLLEGCP